MSFKQFLDKREYKLEDGGLILERIREYFNVPLASVPTRVGLSQNDPLYIDIASYFKDQLEAVSCGISTIAVLQNRVIWERYQHFKNTKKIMEAQARPSNLASEEFMTFFNDTVLFHGTHPDNVNSILEHGLDGRLSRSFGNCGPAIYLSPSFEKCDLFSSRNNNHQRCLIVCVTALGKIYDNNKHQAVDSHTKYPPKGHDCVKHYVAVADEYVVYENAQVLPILAIYYERTITLSALLPPTSGSMFGFPPTSGPFSNGMVQSLYSNNSFNSLQPAHPITHGMSPMSFQPKGFHNTHHQGHLAKPTYFGSNFNLLTTNTGLSSPTGTFQLAMPLNVSSASANPPKDYALRKAKTTMQQWMLKINSTNISNFIGVTLADQQYWPSGSKTRFPNLGSYLEWVMLKKGSSPKQLDSDLLDMLRNLDSSEGIVYARRRQVESTRAVNFEEILVQANAQRLQEAYSTQEGCTICAEVMFLNHVQVVDIVQMKNCPHLFHKSCIETWLSMPSSPRACPNCKTPCYDPMAAPPVGPMPDGDMAYIFNEDMGAWFICYGIPNGTQVDCHSSPGMPFKGTTRNAICPIYLKWGPLLFIRLVSAFYYHHTFTVGTSLTTNCSDSTTWNGIHHKTALDGSYGFPDPTYEDRVSLELDAKGILLFLRDLVHS
ncbi:hypothetical protein G9A89_022145 [Geosiphon pyriformis]|nr:hypothetical protein G9A89_000572 [Geosiphon pyriformis]KAG9303056.1 hypothetical protein G9A89_022145 [Geosiphon pyriformis]